MTKDAARTFRRLSLGDTRHVCAFDIMRTRPMVIIGGILQRKPFFISPGPFVPEFLASHVLARGAVECLFKPFSDAALLDAVNAALRMKQV